MKIFHFTVLMIFSFLGLHAQLVYSDEYTVYSYEEYDFSEFGGQKEFLRSVFKRIRFPSEARRMRGQEKEGEIWTTIQYNGDGTYDIYTRSKEKGTLVSFHLEIERVLTEVIELTENKSREKIKVNLLFAFVVDTGNRAFQYDVTKGELPVVAMPLRPPKRSVGR